MDHSPESILDFCGGSKQLAMGWLGIEGLKVEDKANEGGNVRKAKIGNPGMGLLPPASPCLLWKFLNFFMVVITVCTQGTMGTG
jgi:hypothetical protein